MRNRYLTFSGGPIDGERSIRRGPGKIAKYTSGVGHPIRPVDLAARLLRGLSGQEIEGAYVHTSVSFASQTGEAIHGYVWVPPEALIPAALRPRPAGAEPDEPDVEADEEDLDDDDLFAPTES